MPRRQTPFQRRQNRRLYRRQGRTRSGSSSSRGFGPRKALRFAHRAAREARLRKQQRIPIVQGGVSEYNLTRDPFLPFRTGAGERAKINFPGGDFIRMGPSSVFTPKKQSRRGPSIWEMLTGAQTDFESGGGLTGIRG